MTARYLLRLDDACPTMDAARWDRVEALFRQLEIKPIVAVVPDNQDPDLRYSAPDPKFWHRARTWQDAGWTIALHGYQHRLVPRRAKQYLRMHGSSEFAGLSYDEQSAKIGRGWSILNTEGLRPTAWVAPAHSFDQTTLRALANETPIRTVSDGIAQDQFYEDDFFWIPQQLWSLIPKKRGLWTVCIHPNTMSDGDFERLATSLRSGFAANVTSVSQLRLVRRPRALQDRAVELAFWTRHHIGRAKAGLKRIAGR